MSESLAERLLWHVRRWLLKQRGWDSELAMIALERRLDRASLIDLIERARPGGPDADA